MLARDGRNGLEVLMVQRGQRGVFGGMWVFPGGRVDPEDIEADRPADEQGAARRAAARETAEEVGVQVDSNLFVPLSHWTPPLEAPRRFSTWFFIAPPPATRDIVIDGDEISDHRWLAPKDAISRRDQGEIDLLPPTWVTLWRLASSPTVEAALETARTRKPERFLTRFAQVPDGHVGLWHGDAGSEDGNIERVGGRHRLWMLQSGWRYERSV